MKNLAVVMVGVLTISVMVLLMAFAPQEFAAPDVTLETEAPARVVVPTVVGGYVDRDSTFGINVFRFFSDGTVDYTAVFLGDPCDPSLPCGPPILVLP